MVVKVSFSLFLQEQIHVVDPQGGQLLVRTFEVKQKSTERDENGPRHDLVSC